MTRAGRVSTVVALLSREVAVSETELTLTYSEIADRLGIKLPSARRLVLRRKWHKITGNDGTVRVRVPADFFSVRGQDSTSNVTTDIATDISTDVSHDLVARVAHLEGLLTGLQGQLNAERGRADAERARADAMREVVDGQAKRAETAEARLQTAETELVLLRAEAKRSWLARLLG